MIAMRMMTRTTRILLHFFWDFSGLMTTIQLSCNMQNSPVKHVDRPDWRSGRILTTVVDACVRRSDMMHNCKPMFWGTSVGGLPRVRFHTYPYPSSFDYNRYTHIEPLFDIDIYDLNIFVRLISFIRLHTLDRMHRLQPGKDASKDRVFLVEPRRRIRSDEEL